VGYGLKMLGVDCRKTDFDALIKLIWAILLSFFHDLIYINHRCVIFYFGWSIRYIACDCGKVFYDVRNPEEINNKRRGRL